MSYLKDFLEDTDQLPIELGDCATSMRELDLGAQISLDNMKSSMEDLFSRADELDKSDLDAAFKHIADEFFKSLMDAAEEKVNLANHMLDLTVKCQNYLDEMLAEFKKELETNEPGLPELLEETSEVLDNPQPKATAKKDNKKKK